MGQLIARKIRQRLEEVEWSLQKEAESHLQTEGETAPIEFFDPRPQASISVPRRLKNNIYNSHKVQFDSTQNRGFIFPSWLQHWVSPNYNKRISISWNIQVNGHYGEPNTLQNAYIKKERS